MMVRFHPTLMLGRGYVSAACGYGINTLESIRTTTLGNPVDTKASAGDGHSLVVILDGRPAGFRILATEGHPARQTVT